MIPDVPLPDVRWTDHSQKPVVGMLVAAYFDGEMQTKRLVEWRGNVAGFHDSSSLRWVEHLGFTFGRY
jgi:hypothetical protein